VVSLRSGPALCLTLRFSRLPSAVAEFNLWAQQMENYQETLTSKFDWLSKVYDVFDLVFIFNKKTNPRHNLADKIPDHNLCLLDVCVGTANGSMAIAKKNPQNEITGIDLSSNMLAVGQRKIRKKHIQNVSLQQMDATKMDFENERFDVVTISFALHELDYALMIRVIKEMHRVLKKDGKLYIVDYEKQTHPIKRILLSVFLGIFEPLHMAQFLAHDWERILEGIGFEDIRIEKCLFSKLILAHKPIQRTLTCH